MTMLEIIGKKKYGQELTKEGVLRTSNSRESYLLDAVCPDFYSLLNNTIYIKDKKEKVIGAITPEEWMKEKYFCNDASNLKFKIQNGRIKFLTPPEDDLKIVFQYRSNAVCFDPYNGYQEKNVLTKNTDVPIFDEYLVKLGILWRWLKRNGMDYTEEYAEYEKELKKKFAGSLAVKDIHLDGVSDNFEQGDIINVNFINQSNK